MATGGQLGAVQHFIDQYAALLVADRGAGKTAISLAAYKILKDGGRARKMLVVAPLRVCQLVWRQEAEKWTEFKDFRFSLLHGDKKRERLREDADIYLINPEGCQWLADQFFGRALPFDIVTIDQTIRFKNSQGKRFKALRPKLKTVRHRWGLEGALAPNGYEDLFGQMLILDDGASLGKFITRYRDMYFQPGFDGFSYTLQPGAAARIEARILPYVFRLAYTDLPPAQDEPVFVELPPKERKLYEKMKRDAIVELGIETVTAANSAAVYGKLKQLANGAVYNGKGKEWVHVHDCKLEALEELIDELHGAPLLIGYEFRHDLERLLKKWPDMRTFDGLNEREAIELQRAWNSNEVPYCAAHPASIGHGLNLQQGAACHICWFSPTIDLNMYEEFIGRLRRRGNTAQRVTNHLLIAKDTVDETVTLPALRDKALTQDGLHRRLAEALGIAPKENDMVSKLSRQSAVNPAGTVSRPAPEDRAVAPAGRITPAAWASRGQPQQAQEPGPQPAVSDKPNPFGRRGAAPAEQAEQRAEITRKLTPQTADDTQGTQDENPPAATRARAQFSAGVRQQLDAQKGEADSMAKEVDAAADLAMEMAGRLLAEGAKADPPKRTRRKSDKEPQLPDAIFGVAGNACASDPPLGDVLGYPVQHLREIALHAAIDYRARVLDDKDDVLHTAAAFLDFLEKGGAE